MIYIPFLLFIIIFLDTGQYVLRQAQECTPKIFLETYKYTMMEDRLQHYRSGYTVVS